MMKKAKEKKDSFILGSEGIINTSYQGERDEKYLGVLEAILKMPKPLYYVPEDVIKAINPENDLKPNWTEYPQVVVVYIDEEGKDHIEYVIEEDDYTQEWAFSRPPLMRLRSIHQPDNKGIVTYLR